MLLQFLLLKTVLIFQIIFQCNANCPIYLTLSLDGKSYYGAKLVINWGPLCLDRPGWIGIFTEDPTISNLHPEFRFTNVGSPTGKIITNITIGKLRFPQGWNRDDVNFMPTEYPKGKCLSYYAASFNDNELLTVECLKIQPNWITKLKHITELPLKELFIPGTHSSGAYISSNTQSDLKSIFMKDHVIAQHFDIWSQLVLGIRYFEFSLGFKLMNKYDSNDPENFWIVNENMFVNQLRIILKDIKRFAKISNEVLIMDFSTFPIGFYKHPERHSVLVHILNEEIGDIAVNHLQLTKSCDELTINEIRKMDKNIIILYPIAELPDYRNGPNILCPSWKRFSTGYMNDSQALNYVRLLFSKRENSPVQNEGWVLNAVKTFEQSLNTNELQTAKERANSINPKFARWLCGPWGPRANIIAMDYFSNTNIIDIAIYANLQKAFNAVNKNFAQFEIIEK